MSITGTGRLRYATSALKANARDGNLRTAQSSFALTWVAEWAFTVGIGIVAFRDAGALGVGLIGLLRMLPSALVVPLAGPLADRFRRERMLRVSETVRMVSFAAVAVLVVAGASRAAYAFAVIATVAGTLYRPTHAALLPSLCRTARELAQANAVRGLLDSLATFVGPLLATVLLGLDSLPVIFVAASAAAGTSALIIGRLRYEASPRDTAPRRMRVLADAREGVAAIARERNVVLMFGLAAAQTFTRGALSVFVVVLSIEVLGTGESGAGLLVTAVGAGAVLGSLGASLLSGSKALAAWLGVGAALWGLPIALTGAFPTLTTALVLLACVGIGNALIDLGLFTLPPRLIPDDMLARAFTVLECLVALSVGLGSVVTPLVIDMLGVRGAMVAVGLVAPLLVLLSWRWLRALDAEMLERDARVALLSGVPMLRPLPMPAIEHLARRLESREVPDGAVIFEQGQVGDRFYVIEDGEAEVFVDGELIRRLGAGASFGEVALLREVRRTATVRARGELRLRVLLRAQFAAAVVGYTRSRAEADALIASLPFVPHDAEPSGYPLPNTDTAADQRRNRPRRRRSTRDR